MPEALMIEPVETVSGVRVDRSDSARNAGGQVRPRRISADSFRDLTARLKTSAAPQALTGVAETPLSALLKARQTQDPVTPITIPDFVPPRPEAAAPAAEIPQIEEIAGLPPIPEFVPLPDFAPLDVAEAPLAEDAPAPEFLSDALLSPEPAVEPEAEPEIEAGPPPSDFFDTLELPPFAAVQSEEVLVEAVADEPHAELPEIPAFAPVAEFVAQAETLAEAEPVADEPAIAAVDDFVTEEAQPELLEPELPEPELAEPELPEPELPEPELSEPELAEPELAEDVFEAVEAPSVTVIEPAIDVPLQKLPEPQADGEAKPASAIAGKVVEAMLKTISTAIYAKPSASERAAFLQEMAELMQAAVEETVEHVPPLVKPVVTVAPAPLTVAEAPPAPQPMAETLAGRMGPSAALLKPAAAEPDPFADSEPFAQPYSRLDDPRPQETVDADDESGELALTLLDMMSGGTGSLPHERTLAADTLLRILPRVPVKQLLAVVERVAIMENPPALLVAKLIRDARPEVVAPLLERCSHISDQDLMNAAPDGDTSKLRMIARRRVLSTVLSDHLIATADPAVVLTLIRNPGAALSHEAFFRLAEQAALHHSLLAPLATRADLPPPVAFELFWYVPQELRRFIFSRFLTDSENLNRILKITLATHGGENGEPPTDAKFPPRAAIDAALEAAATYKLDDASQQFAEMAGLARDTILRILSDREGEPFSVLMKALGYQRSRFREALDKLRNAENAVLRPERNPEELETIFDSLSFNKARILLTYWDWYVRKAGPYAPHG